MTLIVKITHQGGPTAHVEVFDHVDREQIVQHNQCFTLEQGESRDVTLYKGRGFRVNEAEAVVDQAEIPLHPSYEEAVTEPATVAEAIAVVSTADPA